MLRSLVVVLLACAISAQAMDKTLKLFIPSVSDSTKQHRFFHELLQLSILEAGYTPKLISREYPQIRIKQLLEKGHLSIYWMLKSDVRDRNFIPIDVGLTNGLIGKRVLLINKSRQPVFDRIEHLRDFRRLKLVAGMGKSWFDSAIWEANGLPYKEHEGNWHSIFTMIAHGRDYDYISRGVNEVLIEKQQLPDLAIEKNMLLVYRRDFIFYLSLRGPQAGKPYAAILRKIMKQAERSGLIDRTVDRFWGDDLRRLNIHKRKVWQLEMP